MSLGTQCLEFGEFLLDPTERVLYRNGELVPLTPKCFLLLATLVDNSGRIVEKDLLIHSVWQGTFVEDGNLSYTIRQLRIALGDSRSHPRYIETVPRRGYRFIAKVERSPGGGRPAPVPDFEAGRPIRGRRLLIGASLLVFAVASLVWYGQHARGSKSYPFLELAFASQKLTTNGKVMHAVISADGKNVFYTNSSSDGKQSVWLRQLDTGNAVEIIPPSGDFYFGLALSPDGNFLYFARRPLSGNGPAAIYRVSIFGGMAKNIAVGSEGWMSLSPDGSKISFVRCPGREEENCSLWIADFDGGNERMIVAKPRPLRIAANSFSPDGNAVVFAFGQSENSANDFALAAIDLVSNKVTELTTERFFNVQNIAWLPNDTRVLVTARRSFEPNNEIWLIDAASGKIRPITQNGENYSALSVDRAGTRLVTTSVKADFRLFLYDLKDPGQPLELGDATTSSFAPDGDLVYSSTMTGESNIWRMDTTGARRRQLTSDPGSDVAPCVSRDGAWVYFASDRSGKVQVYRMRPDGSDQVQVTQMEGGTPIFVSPDGNWVYFQSGRDRSLWRVSAHGGSGEEQVLARGKYRFAISPDGRSVAFAERGGENPSLAVAELPGGKIVKSYELTEGGRSLQEIAWKPDGTGILYSLDGPASGSSSIWLQESQAEKPRKITDLDKGEVWSMSVSQDGRHLSVIQGGWQHDAVLISGLK